jgi:hypothetical protein
LLAQVFGHLAYEPRKALHDRAKRQHAHSQDRTLQLTDQVIESGMLCA